jgi:hypothetical protein
MTKIQVDSNSAAGGLTFLGWCTSDLAAAAPKVCNRHVNGKVAYERLPIWTVVADLHDLSCLQAAEVMVG